MPQRAGDYCRDALAHRTQARRLLVEFVRRMRKFLCELARAATAERVNETGSFQGDVKHRLQGVVENGVAGVVGEVCHQDAHWGMSGFRLTRAYQSKCNHARDEE